MVGKVLKKGVVLAILVLFLGIAVNPSLASITMTSVSNNDVTVEVELCGIEKLGDYGDIDSNYEVQLTKEQAQSLHDLITHVKQKIDECNYREDALPVLRNAVSSLRELGVLRNDMSVDKAQALVTRKDDSYLKQELSLFFEDAINILDAHNILPAKVSSEDAEQISKNAVDVLFDETQDIPALNNAGNRNLMCFVTGETTETCSAGALYYGHYSLLISTIVLLFPFLVIAGILPFGLLYGALNLLIVLLYASLVGNAYYSNLNPVPLGHVIGIGRTFELPGECVDHHPAKGWVKTVGLNGNKTYEGKLYGQIPLTRIAGQPLDYYYPGVLGFTGIKIRNEYNSDKQFYMGTALMTNIGHQLPR